MIFEDKSHTNSSCLVQNDHHLQSYGGGFVQAGEGNLSSSLHQDIQTTTTLVAAISAGSSRLAAPDQQSSYSNAILYGLSVLKEEVHQLQSLVNVAIIQPHHHQQQQLHHLHEQPHDDQSIALAISAMGSQVQEISATASSMMFTIQKYLSTTQSNSPNINISTTHDHQFHQVLHPPPLQPPHYHDHIGLSSSQPNDHHDHPSNVHVGSTNGDRGSFFISDNEHIPHDNYVNNIHHHNSSNGGSNTIAMNNHNNINNNNNRKMMGGGIGLLLHADDENEVEIKEILDDFSPENYEIIELEATDLLAKYTHYCQVCGKGFKRDANLRMHMRAHGDEYKSTAALSNPMKKNITNISSSSKNNSKLLPRKYSCPHEGCRWNKKHPKFQPLKSMICVKNHYKRSHCPKMYVCNRCNLKQFSVLSDLRTHEKHCGDLKWQCSCGTTFSRKDKLMGHCSLFFGHTPSGTTLITRQPENFDLHTGQSY